MADTKITALTALTGADPANDVIPIVDVSDTTMAASGTTKKISVNNILGASGTATLASATINGNTTSNGFIVAGASSVPGAGMWGLATALAFNVNSVEGMRLTSTGLGVGKIPSFNLDIGGANGTTFAITSTGTTSAKIRGYVNGADAGLIGFLSGGGQYFEVAGTEQMRLTTQGLGIGVTPSAWGAGYKALQLGNGLSLMGSTINATLAANAWFDGTNWKYISANPATLYYGSYAGNGSHVWSISSGVPSAGGNVSLTNAMTLDASSNLLLGVTSNPNTARAYFRYDTLTTQPIINSASIVAAATTWNHFVGQSGNGSTVTTNNIFIRGNGDIVNANGIYGTISDLRLKENISDARNYLADLLKLRVVKYSLKEEASAVANKLGFIAQEVEQVFPTMVDTDSEDTKSIKISVLIPMLVKAIQELTARVQTLETR